MKLTITIDDEMNRMDESELKDVLRKVVHNLDDYLTESVYLIRNNHGQVLGSVVVEIP